ncbi:MAG TPA: hypothetical protein VFS38_05570 [Actinomycetota bacterium]|nr:hypothetical protein [Actinomycetota bacterium]
MKASHEQIARGIAGLYGDVSAILGTLPRIQRLELPAGETGGDQGGSNGPAGNPGARAMASE